MKRSTRMSIMRGSLLVALTLFVLACGRDQTMASKSAAAYREARAKGIPVSGGQEHGGHEATATTDTSAAMDHSAQGTAAGAHAGHEMSGMTGTAGGGMARMDHAGMGHGTQGSMAGMDHAAMGHTAQGSMTAAEHAAMSRGAQGSMAGMDHSAMGHGTTTTAGSAAADPHAGMEHGTSTPTDPHAQHQQPTGVMTHAGHGAMQQPGASAPRVVLGAPTTNAEIARTQPAATLEPDDFDAPAASAVDEARKAAGGGGGHEGHGTPPTTGADPHAGHGSASGMSAQTIYTCPMHPEVTSATPGKCPKCGMTLVKKEK